MSTNNEKQALHLIEQAKEALDLEGEILGTDSSSPRTASEWMAWLIDHAVEDIRYCVQNEKSLKWVFGVMRLIERLEILEITPSSDMRFWSYHPEVLNSQEAGMDNRSDVVGYLLQEEFICRECVENEFTGNMEAFWADQPVPLTVEEVLLLGKPPCVSCITREGGEGK